MDVSIGYETEIKGYHFLSKKCFLNCYFSQSKILLSIVKNSKLCEHVNDVTVYLFQFISKLFIYQTVTTVVTDYQSLQALPSVIHIKILIACL